jgi:hypothetical protein
VSAAMPTPGRLPGEPPEDPWPTYDPGLAEDPWLDEPPGPPPWPADDADQPPYWLADDAEPGDPEDVIAWLDAELAKADPWLADDSGWDDPAPPGPPGAPGPGAPQPHPPRCSRLAGGTGPVAMVAGSPLVAWPIICRQGQCWRA